MNFCLICNPFSCKGKVNCMFPIKWIWENMKGYRKQFITAMCLVVIMALLQLVNPTVSRLIVDKILAPAEGVSPQINLLIPMVAIMIGFTLLRTGIGYIMVMLCEKSSTGLVANIRAVIYRNLQRQDMKFYDKNRTGDLMTRLTGDLDMVRHVTAWDCRVALESIVLFFAVLIYFLCTDVLFTLALCVILPVIFFASFIYSRKVRPIYQNLREKLSVMNSQAQENIAGNRVVKAFAREDYEIQQFDQRNADFREANLEANRFWLKFYPVIEFSAQSLTIVVLLVGGLFVMNGRITLGDLMAFSSLTWTFANPVRMLGNILNDTQRFMASANKVIELYYTRPMIVNRADCKNTGKKAKGHITFDHVSLSINKQKILEDITLDIQPGETIAIMGNTGSGKTMLANLIPRLYDVTSGNLLIDDIPIKEWELHALRHSIGMATQDVFLFSDSVDGNIAYGDSGMSEEDVRHYAKISAADFIDKMDEGFETLVGERGVGLSGGQKQRIALARALAIRPSILILDDTTSAVDMETEKFIQNSLSNLDFPCTKLIVAQRVSTTKKADRIIVLQDGKIAEMGTHEELIRKGGYYTEICVLQEAIDPAAAAVKEANA